MRAERHPVRVHAPGKINVSLKVGPLRDDGYHSVASVYLAVSLLEEVVAIPRTDELISVGISAGSELVFEPDDIPLDQSNLAVKAAMLLREHCPGAGGVHLEITKRVPVAGGMGGGSADAAAALVACSVLWNSGFSREDLARIAAELGADVPFALLGGTAVGLGIGDRLTPALARAATHWVLVPATYGLSTPRVYATLDALRERRLRSGGPAAAEPVDVDPRILQAMQSGDPRALAPLLENDLQAAAVELVPELAEMLKVGTEEGALKGIVSGSGPTLAFLAADQASARQTAARIEDRTGVAALAVHGPVSGARVHA